MPNEFSSLQDPADLLESERMLITFQRARSLRTLLNQGDTALAELLQLALGLQEQLRTVTKEKARLQVQHESDAEETKALRTELDALREALRAANVEKNLLEAQLAAKAEQRLAQQNAYAQLEAEHRRVRQEHEQQQELGNADKEQELQKLRVALERARLANEASAKKGDQERARAESEEGTARLQVALLQEQLQAERERRAHLMDIIRALQVKIAPESARIPA